MNAVAGAGGRMLSCRDSVRRDFWLFNNKNEGFNLQRKASVVCEEYYERVLALADLLLKYLIVLFTPRALISVMCPQFTVRKWNLPHFGGNMA